MLQDLMTAFEEAKNPQIAAEQAAYMKNRFPFLGLKAPLRRAIQKKVFTPPENLEETLQALWKMPEREYTYAALDLAVRYRKKIHHLPFIKSLIESHSWWDSVDILASNVLGYFVEANPKHLETMDQWIEDDNFWVRRSALLCQLKWKKNTDHTRLFAYCKKCAHESEFFIRKAIGWALREYSKSAPEAVQQFISENRSKLSPLSLREGSRHLNK